MSVEEIVPFPVLMASYCVEFHDRNTCAKCTDQGCPRLDDAALVLDQFRAQRLERYRLNRRTATSEGM